MNAPRSQAIKGKATGYKVLHTARMTVYAKPRNAQPAALAIEVPPIVEALPPKKIAAAQRHKRLLEAMQQPADPDTLAFIG